MDIHDNNNIGIHNDIVFERMAIVRTGATPAWFALLFMSVPFLMIDSICFCYLIDQIGDDYSVTIHL